MITFEVRHALDFEINFCPEDLSHDANLNMACRILQYNLSFLVGIFNNAHCR